MTTAALTLWPHIDVPAPRGRIAAPWLRQSATAATTSSTVRGRTTPIGT
jgi:hypothetical protein